MPGRDAEMDPRPDDGETRYKGSGRLAGRKAIVTGGDSGIGKAVALAFAREGADVLIAYDDEHDDAREAARLAESAGRRWFPATSRTRPIVAPSSRRRWRRSGGEAPRPAGRAQSGLRDAGERGGELRLGRHRGGDRRQADDLMAGPVAS